LAGLGALGGLALAFAGVDVLKAIVTDLPRLHEVGVDDRVIAATATVALGCGVCLGLVPLVSGRRPEAADALKGEARGGAPDRRARTLRGMLVTAEFALA
ncbi:MAG: permease, partial [Gammaproteobacteria bacterium]|nr:permease [Gemmatimonadota bacterium]NIU76394.1 permease [Gammaproteobacteria bacterium]NIX22246.1 permease [Actinomycetota bacterium]